MTIDTRFSRLPSGLRWLRPSKAAAASSASSSLLRSETDRLGDSAPLLGGKPQVLAGLPPPQTGLSTNLPPPATGLTLAARVGRGDLTFRSLYEALEADARFGSQQPAVAAAALTYVQGHLEHDNFDTIRRDAQALGATGVAAALDAGGQGHLSPVHQTHVCDAGRGVARATPNGIVSWRYKSGNRQFSLRAESPIGAIAPHSQGCFTVSGDTWTLWPYNPWVEQEQTLSPVHSFKGGPVQALSTDGHGGIVALDLGGTVTLWNKSGSYFWSRGFSVQPKSPVRAFCGLEERSFAVATDGPKIRIYTEGQKRPEKLTGHTGKINQLISFASLGLHPAYEKGGLISVSDDATARVWFKDKKGHWRVQVCQGHAAPIRSVTQIIEYAPGCNERRFVTVSEDGSARIWTPTQNGDFTSSVVRLPLSVDATSQPLKVIGGGFDGFALASGVGASQVHTWTRTEGWRDVAEINAPNLEQALDQNRLTPARTAWLAGERPSDADFARAAANPSSALARLGTEHGMSLRNSAGESLVGVALEDGHYEAAATHLLRGVRCNIKGVEPPGEPSHCDVEAALSRAANPDCVPVLAALIARGLMDPERVPADAAPADRFSRTLFMHLCLLNLDEQALQLLGRGPSTVVFPTTVGTLDPTTLQAARLAVRTLEIYPLYSYLAQAPANLRAALLSEVVATEQTDAIELCIDSAEATHYMTGV